MANLNLIPGKGGHWQWTRTVSNSLLSEETWVLRESAMTSWILEKIGQYLIHCCRAELGFKESSLTNLVPGKSGQYLLHWAERGFKGRVPWAVCYLGKADSVWFTVRQPQLFLPSGSHLKLAGWPKNKNICNKFNNFSKNTTIIKGYILPMSSGIEQLRTRSWFWDSCELLML